MEKLSTHVPFMIALKRYNFTVNKVQEITQPDTKII